MSVRSLHADEFMARHRGFFEYLLHWRSALQTVSLADLTAGGDGRRLALVSVDLIKGFVSQGTLASKRISAVVPSIVDLFRAAHAAGVRNFVLIQDAHPQDSPEFDAYGPHCIEGTTEAETADELAALPFAGEFTMMLKRTVSVSIGTPFDRWLEENRRLETVIAVGDCTDICVYQLAMQVKMLSNYWKRNLRVIVPEDCVQTYDLGVEAAGAVGSTPHDGDLLHLIFLYHMALNGIEVVEHIAV